MKTRQKKHRRLTPRIFLPFDCVACSQKKNKKRDYSCFAAVAPPYSGFGHIHLPNFKSCHSSSGILCLCRGISPPDLISGSPSSLQRGHSGACWRILPCQYRIFFRFSLFKALRGSLRRISLRSRRDAEACENMSHNASRERLRIRSRIKLNMYFSFVNNVH